MDDNKRKPDKPLSAFEEFVRAIAGVPTEEAIRAEEAAKRKRPDSGNTKRKSA